MRLPGTGYLSGDDNNNNEKNQKSETELCGVVFCHVLDIFKIFHFSRNKTCWFWAILVKNEYDFDNIQVIFEQLVLDLSKPKKNPLCSFFFPMMSTTTKQRTSMKEFRAYLQSLIALLLLFGKRCECFSRLPQVMTQRTYASLSSPSTVWTRKDYRPCFGWSSDFDDNQDEEDDELDYDEEPEELDEADIDYDWVQAEFTLLKVPPKPHPKLDPMDIATLTCRSLQFVDYPSPNAGLERCFSFFTHDCRALVTARQGAKSVERFVKWGQSAPALQPFMGASRVIIGDGTYTAAKPPLRGALVSYPISIESASILSVRHQSGMNRVGVAAPPITKMVLRLEQQRRPPNQSCWLVKEILDVRHAFAGDMGNAHVGA